MAALVFLLLGLVFALIARGLLIKAAFGVSVGWGFGVFLPFGPLVFRLKYPDDARPARKFQLATLPCIALYLMIGPGTLPTPNFSLLRKNPSSVKLPGYGTEAAAPKQPAQGSFEERRAANEREYQRLRRLSEELKARKRDLLKSDTEGALAYNMIADEYNAALDKYNAEKTALALLAEKTVAVPKPTRP